MNEQVQKIMSALGVDEQTALDVIECDKRIDKGEKLFELNQKQKQTEKQMRATGTRSVTVYKFDKRERKADNAKAGLIELFAAVLKEQPACTELNITNGERQIDFAWMGRKMRLVLSAPRT